MAGRRAKLTAEDAVGTPTRLRSHSANLKVHLIHRRTV
jgi:hypothetical protein